MLQGAKKIIFTACYSGKLKLIFTSPNIISTSPKNVLMSRLISKFFSNLNSSKNFTCPFAELITEFTTPIAKSTGPGLSDTTFFARWCFVKQCGHENLLWTWSPKMNWLDILSTSHHSFCRKMNRGNEWEFKFWSWSLKGNPQRRFYMCPLNKRFAVNL